MANLPFDLEKFLANNPYIDYTQGYSGSQIYYIAGDYNCYLKTDGKGVLYPEYVGLKFLSNNGLAPKPLNYISSDNGDYLFVEAAKGEVALEKFSGNQLIRFMAESLRDFHDHQFSFDGLSPEEKRMILEKSNSVLDIVRRNYEEKRYCEPIIQHLGIKERDLGDFLDYIVANISELKPDTIIHEDFNPRNVFSSPDGKYMVIDSGDVGFNDKHIDIVCTIIVLGIITGEDVRKRFLAAYGEDAIDPKRLVLAEKIAPLYYC